MNKLIVQMFCFLCLVPIEIKATSGLQYWKHYFDQRSGTLDCLEGIYVINMTIEKGIELTTCKSRNYSNPRFDTISVFRRNNDFVVHSILLDKVVGRLKVEKSIKQYDQSYMPRNSYYEDIKISFEGNGTKNYPSSDAKFQSDGWFRISYEADNVEFQLTAINFLHDNKYDILSSDLVSKIQYTCSEYNKLNQALSSFLLISKAKRIYPNKNEIPQILGVSTGTGVVISSNGFVITNFHVIKEQKYNWEWTQRESCDYGTRCEVNIYNWIQVPYDTNRRNDIDLCSDSIVCKIKDKFYTLRVVAASYSEDWAILKIEDSLFTTKDFAIIDTLNNSLGSEVYTLGFPISQIYGNDVKYTNGYISSNVQKEYYSLNMGINPGNSGGGLFSKANGQLIGLTTSRFNNESVGVDIEGVSFSIRVNHVARILKTEEHLFLHYIYNDSDRGWWSVRYRSVRYRYSTNKSKRPKVLIKDVKYNPITPIERNINATVQIFSE
jgi:S1-C subfamily serine protease